MRLHYLLCLCLPLWTQSQTIVPEGRATDWSAAGREPGTTPSTGNFIDVVALGADPEGNEPAESVVQFAINRLSEQGGGTIYFPPGSYLFTDGIELRSNIVLKGAGSKVTRLRFSVNGSRHLMLVAGSVAKDSTALKDDALLNTKTISVWNTKYFKPGTYALLLQNDSNLVTDASAYHSVGQLVKIAAQNGNGALHMRSPLRKSYQQFETPWLQRIEPIHDVGIECLKIERPDLSTAATSHIYFDLAVNCWVSGVESERCNYAHVTMHRSSNLTVSGSYFYTATVYDRADMGYGVVAEATTGECLIENNIFRGLRHAMLVQSGANGNVFAYNYARESYWNEPFLSFNAAGDIVLHGNYPFFNLFEGNLIQNITIDDTHGLSGPCNTFFRNRTQYYGIAMTFPSERQNFIGNEVINNNVGRFLLVGEEHFLYGNNVRGAIIPANTAALQDTSLYLKGASPYIQGNPVFPALGLPNALNTGSILTRLHFFSGTYTDCEVNILTGTDAAAETDSWSVYPNPANDYAMLSLAPETEPAMLCRVQDAGGRVWAEQHVQDGARIELSGYPAGLYYLQLIGADGKTSRRMLSVIR